MKYTLFTINLFYVISAVCPILNFFKYKSNTNEKLKEKYNETYNESYNEKYNQSYNEIYNQSYNKIYNEKENKSYSELNEYIHGKATFYFKIGDNIDGCPSVQSFNDGNSYGPCNFNGTQGVKYNLDSKYWCAIKNAKSYCGNKVVVYYENNFIELQVMDECPFCDNNIDMSLEALIELTGSKENACAINKQLPQIKWYITF